MRPPPTNVKASSQQVHRIRPIDPTAPSEIALVAKRMRETLVEVLGEERGGSMYTMEWLIARVQWHLNPTTATGQVFLAIDPSGTISGHTIVRVEASDSGEPFGLFSTTFVAPEYRRLRIASHLLERGEVWMKDRDLASSATYTAHGNDKLIRLFERCGYQITAQYAEMVRLEKFFHPNQ